MEKIICFTIHTERLHSDSLWKEIQKILKFFKKYNIKATWFSINPEFFSYQAVGFDKDKWKERLKFLTQNGQTIEQHTHFYKEEDLLKEREYDLSPLYIAKRIQEDKEWLENQGFPVNGFISGSWKLNKDILLSLKKEGFKYDLTTRGDRIHFLTHILTHNHLNNWSYDENVRRTLFVYRHFFNEILEIPTLSNLRGLVRGLPPFSKSKRFIRLKNFSFSTVYFHDFDLERPFFRVFLRALIFYLHLLGFKFISAGTLYKKIYDNY